jgi:predicted secreted hydrolase
MREWWYFNVIFDKEDSDLLNWSVMISFNHGSNSFEKPDILFVTLYDNKNSTYGGMISRDENTLKADKSGINITFEKSSVKGLYPEWKLYIEDDEADVNHNITINLHFRAQSRPYWVGLNTGLGFTLSPLGYYSINHCNVDGTITIDDVIFEVSGTGYHDHMWAPYFNRASGFWDWFSVHFDNGLHAFIWLIIPIRENPLIMANPRFFWLTDGQKFTELKLFDIEYIEFENTSIPHFNRPKTFHITSTSNYPKIDLYLYTRNIYEYIWERTSDSTITAMWEGTCMVNGTIEMESEVSYVNGSAIAEIIRIF